MRTLLSIALLVLAAAPATARGSSTPAVGVPHLPELENAANEEAARAAAKRVEEAILTRPPVRQDVERYALALERQGLVEEAIAAIRTHGPRCQDGHGVRVQLLLSEILERAGRLDDSLRAAEQAAYLAEVWDGSPQTAGLYDRSRLRLAVLATRRGGFEDGRRLLLPLLQRRDVHHEHWVEALVVLLETAVRDGRVEDIRHDLRQLPGPILSSRAGALAAARAYLTRDVAAMMGTRPVGYPEHAHEATLVRLLRSLGESALDEVGRRVSRGNDRAIRIAALGGWRSLRPVLEARLHLETNVRRTALLEQSIRTLGGG
jgi:hypothetical protein